MILSEFFSSIWLSAIGYIHFLCNKTCIISETISALGCKHWQHISCENSCSNCMKSIRELVFLNLDILSAIKFCLVVLCPVFIPTGLLIIKTYWVLASALHIRDFLHPFVVQTSAVVLSTLISTTEKGIFICLWHCFKVTQKWVLAA